MIDNYLQYELMIRDHRDKKTDSSPEPDELTAMTEAVSHDSKDISRVEFECWFESIDSEIGTLHSALDEHRDDEIRWRELFSASVALQWVRDRDIVRPSVTILNDHAPRKRWGLGRATSDVF